jgi:anti-anti-sigma factor
MQITVRIEGEKAIVAIDGDLVEGQHLPLVRENVTSLIGDGYREIVIDLRSARYVDSAGLGALVATYATAKHHGVVLQVDGLKGSAAVQNLIDEIKDVFRRRDD